MISAILPLSVPNARARNRRVSSFDTDGVAQEWLRLGTRAALDGHRSDARYYFVQAVRSDMESARAWLYLGGVADDPALTLSCMQKVLQLDPDNADARAGLLWARTRLGLLPPAPPPAPFAPFTATREVIPHPLAVTTTPPRPPDTSDNLVRRGIHAANEGDADRARYYFLRAIALDTTNTRAWLYLGGTAHDPALTLAAMEQVLVAEPDNRAAHEGALWARSKLGLSTVGTHLWHS
jgi:tetratricopeptide (TPR) repeat protein